MSVRAREIPGHRQSGVSMVEALVALVVLSVGMLGIASLYVASLQAGRTALIRTQAVQLVNDMIDRIRANAPAGEAYDMQETYGGAPADQGCVAKADNCSSVELAQDDLAKWKQSVEDQLPGAATADVVVTTVGGGQPDTYVVRVTWKEPGDDQTLSYQGNLTLVPVTP